MGYCKRIEPFTFPRQNLRQIKKYEEGRVLKMEWSKKALLVYYDGEIANVILTEDVSKARMIAEQCQTDYRAVSEDMLSEDMFFSDLFCQRLTAAGIKFDRPDFDEVFEG